MSPRSLLARHVARCIAITSFKGRPDIKDKLDDAESVCFEIERTAQPKASPASIAYRAVQRVKCGRQFNESIRSLTATKHDSRSKRPKELHQVHLCLHDLAASNAPPSETVPIWMDYQEWLAGLGERKRRIAESLAMGNGTCEVAEEFSVSPGRIAQMKREFETDWKAFQHET